MRKHLTRQLRKQPHLLRLLQLIVNRVNTLALLIPNSTQPIPRNSTRHSTRHIRHNETHRASTSTSHDRPERARRTVVLALRHALIVHHLLKHAPELLVRVLVRIALALRLPAKPKRRPREIAKAAWHAAAGFRARDFFRWVVRLGVGAAEVAKAEAVGSCGIVLATARGV
jgi:hypothetical protein